MIDSKRLYQLVGKRIFDLRSAKEPKLSQKQLADLIGIERTSISNIENGSQRVTLAFLYQLSEQLSISLSDLLPALDEVILKDVTTGKSSATVVPPKTAQVIKSLTDTNDDPH